MIPYPLDGEVEEFKLISLEEVIDAVVKRKFKLNLAMGLGGLSDSAWWG